MKLAEALSLRADLQKQVDASAKALRELDVRIQGVNWTSDLL